MTEGVFQSYDPFAYKVNNVSDLDKNVVSAYKRKDSIKIAELINDGTPVSYDVFICIDNHLHACLLLIPANDDSPFDHIKVTSDDPFNIPDQLMCWRVDLRYEEIQLKTYKISKQMNLFKEFKKSIKKSFHIGRYEKVRHIKCFDLAILRSAPHNYNAILNDCVEFAKEFCRCLLSYCENGKTLEAIVYGQIKKATVTGLSVEYLSRNFAPSGILGNLLAGGSDVSSFLSRNPIMIFVAAICFILYPILATLLTLYLFKNYF